LLVPPVERTASALRLGAGPPTDVEEIGRGAPAGRSGGMSGKNNVNPGQYKVAGRERQGEDVVHEKQKQSMAQERARLARQRKDRPGPTKRGPEGDDGGGEVK
jgi:hypothetical protein